MFFHKGKPLTNQTTQYSDLGINTISGTIYHAEIVTKDGSSFLAVSVIHTPVRDGQPIVFTFNDNAGLMALHQKGYFCKGREVTITGHITGVSEIYTDKESGELRTRKYPQIHMTRVSVPEGGLGRMPKSQQRPAAGTVVTRVGTPAEEYGANNPIIDGAPAF